MTIYIKPSHMPAENTLEEIRSEKTNKVLPARKGESGIYLWERNSRTYYLLTWEYLVEVSKSHATVSPKEQPA